MMRAFPRFLRLISRLTLCACALAASACSREKAATETPVVMRVALPLQLSSGSTFVGNQLGLFKQHQVTLEIQKFQLGKDALQSVLQGRADLAVVADTPFMFAALRGEPVAAVATVFGSRSAIAVLGWRKRGIAKVADLRGKTVASVAGTNAQYFLDALLVSHGVAPSDVKVVALKSDQMAAALRSGQVDAVTVWHPELGRLKAEMEDDGVALYGDDIFVYRFLLVGRRDYLDNHPAEVAQFVAALADATDAVHEQPARAREIVGTALGIAPALLAEYFEPADYYLALDQSLLLALGDQSRWAMKQGLAPAGPVPNYLELLRQQPLRAARANAVKVIQ